MEAGPAGSLKGVTLLPGDPVTWVLPRVPLLSPAQPSQVAPGRVSVHGVIFTRGLGRGVSFLWLNLASFVS